jgi:hypothetical protein
MPPSTNLEVSIQGSPTSRIEYPDYTSLFFGTNNHIFAVCRDYTGDNTDNIQSFCFSCFFKRTTTNGDFIINDRDFAIESDSLIPKKLLIDNNVLWDDPLNTLSYSPRWLNTNIYDTDHHMIEVITKGVRGNRVTYLISCYLQSVGFSRGVEFWLPKLEEVTGLPVDDQRATLWKKHINDPK